MLNFREKLKKRRWLIRISCVIVLLVIINHYFGNFLSFPTPKEPHISDFQMGLLMGIELCLIFLSFKYRKAINDENELQDFYNSEHDERKNLIRQKAGYPVIWAASIVILIAAIIAGYYNVTVFYSLAAVAVIQIFFAAFLKFVYSKKY